MILSGGYFKDRKGEWQRYWAPEVGEGEETPPFWPHPAGRFMAPRPDTPTEEIIMNMRAKFRVTGVNKQQTAVGLTMEPVHGTHVDGKYVPQAENSRFWEASPNGKFEMWVAKGRPAYDYVCGLEVGAEFYLDFTPAVVVDELKPSPSA